VLPPSDHVAGFIAQLVLEGYRPESILKRRAWTARLARWLERRQRQLATLDEDTLRSFLAVPDRSSPNPRPRSWPRRARR